MPPRLARLPRVPSPGSARARERAKPGAPDDWYADNEPVSAEAVSHGSAASTASTQRGGGAQPARPAGARHGDAHQRHRRGQHQAGRGQSGQRDPERQREHAGSRLAVRSRTTVAAPPRAGSRSRPAGSSAPAAVVRRHRDSRSPPWSPRTGRATPASGSTVAASRAAPQPASHSPATSSVFTTTPPSSTWRPARPRSPAAWPAAPPRQAQCRIGQIRPRRRHRVAQQQVARRQQRRRPPAAPEHTARSRAPPSRRDRRTTDAASDRSGRTGLVGVQVRRARARCSFSVSASAPASVRCRGRGGRRSRRRPWSRPGSISADSARRLNEPSSAPPISATRPTAVNVIGRIRDHSASRSRSSRAAVDLATRRSPRWR